MASSSRSLPVELHIESLQLHGFARGDRDRIAAAVQAELQRLLSERGLPAQSQRGPIRIALATSGAGRSAIGSQVAGALAGELWGAPGRPRRG
jgi:hypothetical protein